MSTDNHGVTRILQVRNANIFKLHFAIGMESNFFILKTSDIMTFGMSCSLFVAVAPIIVGSTLVWFFNLVVTRSSVDSSNDIQIYSPMLPVCLARIVVICILDTITYPLFTTRKDLAVLSFELNGKNKASRNAVFLSQNCTYLRLQRSMWHTISCEAVVYSLGKALSNEPKFIQHHAVSLTLCLRKRVTIMSFPNI